MKNETIYRDASALCTPSKLPASDYVINPYIGCIHRCKYCYASFMGRFTGHTEPWGTYLEPKKYSSYKLPGKIDSSKTILIGSVTDAYNPSESKYSLMPRILESLQDCSAHVEILTKSSLVLRDIDLIKQIPRELHENKIRTYLFIAPYLPGITNLNALYDAVEGTVDYICVENLNLRGNYKQPMLDAIQSLHPDLSGLWDDIYTKKKSGVYWAAIEKQIEALRHKSSVPIISYMYHEKIKKS